MPGLTEVAVYRRRIGAGLERVWENVLDWEHLPWLHSSSFASIEALEADRDGWRARVGIGAGDATLTIEIDLRAERERGRYLTATVGGFGTGTEIWTELAVASENETDIEVRFRVPDVAMSEVERVGASYLELYDRLWDEDEVMMQHRAAMLGLLASDRRSPASIDLGPREAVLAKVPFVVDLGGLPYRVVAVDGELLAHPTICPHALGPLDAGAVIDGRVRCPWHGYEFDLRSAASCDGRKLRLGAMPAVRLEKDRVRLELEARPRGGADSR